MRFFLLLLAATCVRADVVDSAANGFTTKNTVEITGAASNVFDAVVKRIGSWWDPAHTFSQNAANLYIDTANGGCFCERLPDGGSVRHLNLVWLAPGKTLRFTGAMGPMQAMALTGSMTWTFTEAAGKTRVELTWAIGGYAPGGADALAKIVDAVMMAQLQRLKRFVETGTAAVKQ
jgi:hypothetical protein